MSKEEIEKILERTITDEEYWFFSKLIKGEFCTVDILSCGRKTKKMVQYDIYKVLYAVSEKGNNYGQFEG